MTTQEAWKKTEKIILEWSSIRRHNDLGALQKIRDDMAEHLIYLGQVESQYDSESALLKGEIEQCMDEFKENVRKDTNEKKPPGVDELNTQARNHCRTQITQLIHAENNWKYFNRLIKRCDQVLNSTASAQKVIMKNL